MTEYTNVAEAVRLMRTRRGDTESIEAKACGGGLSKDVWESVSAFANSHGGILILGLDERENFVPAKGFDADRAFVQDAEPEDFDPEKVERLIASEIAKESRAIRGASTRRVR